ncbi:MAG: hypothetical protein U0169_12900 [Polyangiaceae bacterium]
MATAKKTAKGKADGKSSAKDKGGKADPKADGKRKLGLRGAAPWAARHAAKHAAEARARAAEPPLPGSARATIRTPAGAEDIKAKIGDLHNALIQIKGLRKNLHKTFWDIGGVLREIQNKKLYIAKGYGTFDAFVEREIDLGKTTSLRLTRVVSVFQKDAALEYGMDRVLLGLAALEGIEMSGSSLHQSTARLPPPSPSTTSLPLKPPGRM